MQSGLLRVTRMGYTAEGHPYLLLTARYGHIKKLVVYLKSDQPAEWEFGYEVYDPGSGTRTSYIGPHGDPDLDESVELVAIPGLDE